jgi:2',3'-cyclic-nucleotide 2'-phosphodiesterase (5'-nucleotidase family)
MKNKIHLMLVLILIAGLVLPASVPSRAAPPVPVTFTILHTNDFHGNLELAGSNPGLARLATTVNNVRAVVGAGNVLLVDAGDSMQGSLLSNILQGKPVIDAFNVLGYDVATVGNHEFDWGQVVLATRIDEAEYPYVAANLVVNDTGNCATAGWTSPSYVSPYEKLSVGDPVPVTVGFIGVTSQETPYITIAEATQGLCFKDPAESILHYYDELSAQVDVIVVLSHIGYSDGGYGYGLQVYGDQTLAQRLIDAGKPVPLIIGGHSHTDLSAATMVGPTAVVQAHYAGRKVGRADITVGTDGSVSVAWGRLVVGTSDPEDPDIKALVQSYVDDPDYQALINTPVGYAQVDLLRNYNGNSMMADFINDAIYNQLNSDAEPLNNVDMVFNNSGGIRSDWCDAPDPLNPAEYIWTSDPILCQAEGLWMHDPMLLTYGQMFTVLPFGNATIVGDMTGAQILELLHQSATLFKGTIQPAGIRYSFYRYSDALPGPQPYAWGAFDITVYNKATGLWEELDLDRTYRVGTNEFLAPAGQDGFVPFKYMTNISYWGDMLNLVNAWASANYTFGNPFRGPNGDGLLDGRITRDGTDAGGAIVPITILHHNDSHGNLAKGTYVGYTQLATLIKQERLHNPERTLLLTAGDNIQGDAMMYYFKSAALGYAADGRPLPADLQINPLIKAFNTMDYDAMTVGNHEYNFGAEIFTSSLAQATFPMLQANVEDDGSYGIADVPVEPYVETTVGPEGIKVAILGIGNHRVPNYELPSNIPGLSFPNPITTAQEYADELGPVNDVVIALTHIGFTEQPGSVEVDTNVDTNMADSVTGIDTIIGSHSHTNPATGFGPYKYLPTIISNPDQAPVLVHQAYRYNNTLGQVVMGLRPDGSGGYEVVSNTGRYHTVAMTTPEDEGVKALIQPYVDLLAAYNATEIGQTTAPIDALQAYTQETTGANLQADASVWELEDNHGIPVDFHLSGAMSNRKVADTATPASPVTLKVADMFTLMPYENSLVVMEMNGPQIKAVLERAFRNYYYYKYVPGRGGYSYYTTCMIDINHGGQITYNDLYPEPYDPDKEYVVSLVFDGQEVDFDDADTYYRVSTVNYLAAGSCNFNNAGVSLWPLDQIVNDTQYYVRDSVIYYIQDQGVVSPAIEGRLQFINDVDAPVITIVSPAATQYVHPDYLTLDFSAVDVGPAGLKEVWADLDGMPVVNGQVIDLHTLALGEHTLTVYAMDKAYNTASASVTFTVIATPFSLRTSLDRLYAEGEISNWGNYVSLVKSLESFYRMLAKGNLFTARVMLEAFIQKVENQSGIHITPEAAALLVADAHWVLDHLGELSAAAFDMSGYTSPYKDVFLPISIH